MNMQQKVKTEQKTIHVNPMQDDDIHMNINKIMMDNEIKAQANEAFSLEEVYEVGNSGMGSMEEAKHDPKTASLDFSSEGVSNENTESLCTPKKGPSSAEEVAGVRESGMGSSSVGGATKNAETVLSSPSSTSELIESTSPSSTSELIGIADVNSKDVKKRKTIIARKTAIQNPMVMDAIRRTRIGLQGGEVVGKLKFVVPQSQVLELPPTADDDNSEGSRVAAAVRETLGRRFEDLHPSRKEDDASYFDAVEKGIGVNLVTALPPGYDSGGWRCHATRASKDHGGQVECLHVNRTDDEHCGKCQSAKPNIRPEFAYLRLLPRGLRRQRREYERIIRSCDDELNRGDAAEQEASDRIDAIERDPGHQDQEGESAADTDSKPSGGKDEEDLMMDINLVQGGTWQRVDARTLLPILATRKLELRKRLATARAELCILVQAAFCLAVPHVQRVTRRFLVRLRLDDIRKSVLDFARFSAAVEIQRIARSKLARREADRLRILRDHFMATRIQSLARRRFSIAERKHLYAIYIEKLRNKSATTIQSLYRCHVAKLIAKEFAEERRRILEEQEKAMHATLEYDSAAIIQKHCRRVLAKAKCANRRVELGLHKRLLMYLERYVVDGCMWSFVKSINDDYIRYERTITHTIEREEKMAKTFVEKVINARDGDHTSAWENYIDLTQEDNDSMAKDIDMGSVCNTPSKKSSRKEKKNLERRSRHKSTMKIYGSTPQQRNIASRKSHTRRVRPKSDERSFDPMLMQDIAMEHINQRALAAARPLHNHHNSIGSEQTHVIQASTKSKPLQHDDAVEDGQTSDELDVSYQQEAKRLTSLNRMKDKLRGQYLRFDIPDSLDDSVARFIMSVTLRYKFETPGESSVHGNFELESVKREHQQKCMMYAEPLIQRLHEKGFVFIRQLLPVDNMIETLFSMGVPEEFLLLSSWLMNVLYQIHGGNHLNRKALMAKCRHLLDTQQQMRSDAKSSTLQNFSLAAFLGECGAAGSDDYNDDDNPGGLWMPEARPKTKSCIKTLDKCNPEPKRGTGCHLPDYTRKTRTRSWVIPYTSKIISENESKHPALKPYRHAQLLSNAEDTS